MISKFDELKELYYFDSLTSLQYSLLHIAATILIYEKAIYFFNKKRLNVKMINHIRDFVEIQVFGVCTYLGDKIGLPYRHIRLYFLYATFITLGSPIIIYLTLAFILNLRNYIRGGKKTILRDW